MCLVYLIFWTFRDLSLIPPLAGLAVFKMGQIPSILKKINSNPYEKYILIDTISGILFQSLLIISLSSDFSLLLSGIPIYLSNLVLSCKSYSNSCRFLIFANIAKAIFRWLFIVTFICLALKHENFIEWPWIFVFWPYWLTLFGIGFMCILHVFTMCILKLQGNTSLLCPLWLLYINLGFTVSCSFFFAGFADFLETSSKSSLLLPLLILISYFLLFCTGTLLLLTPLSNFVINIFSSSIPEVQSDNNPLAILRTIKKPFFLIRISSTYYQEKINSQTPEEAKSISENSIKDCLLCCELPCDGVLMPCGHSGICYQCAVKLLESNKPCYICRNKLKSAIQIISKENKVVLVTELDE